MMVLQAGPLDIRSSGKVIVPLGFIALLAGRFTLDRAGLEIPVVNDPRLAMFWLLLASLIFEGIRRQVRTTHATPLVGIILLFLLYQALSTMWSPEGARVAGSLTDLAAMAFLVFVYGQLACWDAERVIRLTLTCCLVAGVVYFLAAASGQGHAPNDRWAALGGGPNVFVRVMVLASIAAIYFYSRDRAIAWLLLVPVLLTGAVLSGSRGGLVALVATTLLAVLFGALRVRLTQVILLVLATVGATGLIHYVLGSGLMAMAQQRFVVTTFHDGYVSGRADLFWQAIRQFTDSPVIGTGMDGFYALTYADLGDQYAHSLPLAVAAEGGAVGLSLLVGALYALRRAYARVPRDKHTVESRVAGYCGVFVLLAGLFSGDYYDARFMWIFLLLAAAGSVNQRAQGMNYEFDRISSDHRDTRDESRRRPAGNVTVAAFAGCQSGRGQGPA